ncbi:hypothetical protein [Dactylosporangium salmoneum]|uniref:SnoaL-like domain-containing protein n=1 Tax=Dactylosporangium salmoneum TaxID=53361 RepID=A0ABN3FB50_9ACTN
MVPVGYEHEPDGRVAVAVHQVVRDTGGSVIADQMVTHVYRFDGDAVAEMEIRQ